MAKKQTGYAEPTDYFPKAIRKKYGLGEYYKEEAPAPKKETPKKEK